ncbi:acyl-CoA thioesterase [Zunongwangia sp.]|uniref:acyl-CoA thioesterase n=1 Tax=Zunongwangia sp. TaxID=1965325 RepID=UPI003AA92D5E
MKSHKTTLKVRYAETDQMGVVHHGNYAQYLEIARISWLENVGISYKDMEKNGIMLPVYEMNFKFKKSAFFDDELTIVTRLKTTPDVRISFDYEIYNKSGELLTTATTILVFMDAKKRRPIRCPKYVLELLGKD